MVQSLTASASGSERAAAMRAATSVRDLSGVHRRGLVDGGVSDVGGLSQGLVNRGLLDRLLLGGYRDGGLLGDGLLLGRRLVLVVMMTEALAVQVATADEVAELAALAVVLHLLRDVVTVVGRGCSGHRDEEGAAARILVVTLRGAAVAPVAPAATPGTERASLAIQSLLFVAIQGTCVRNLVVREPEIACETT